MDFGLVDFPCGFRVFSLGLGCYMVAPAIVSIPDAYILLLCSNLCVYELRGGILKFCGRTIVSLRDSEGRGNLVVSIVLLIFFTRLSILRTFLRL